MNSTAPKALVAIESPSEQQLLLWIQSQVDQSVLKEIAANDRGNDTAKHLASIQRQLRPNPPMGLLPYWPLEVLRLEQFSEPDSSAERGQLKRFLACTVLLRNGAYILSYSKYSDEEAFLETLAGTLLQLTRSALALDMQLRALGFVLWFFDNQKHPGLKPFAAFCAFVLAVASDHLTASESSILEVCNWVEREEIRYRKAQGYHVYSDRWLVGLNLHERSANRRKRWSSVARQVLGDPPPSGHDKAREAFQSFTTRLEGNQ